MQSTSIEYHAGSEGKPLVASETIPPVLFEQIRPTSERAGLFSREIISDLVGVLEAAIVFACAAMGKYLYIDVYLGISQDYNPYLVVGMWGAIQSFFLLKHRGHYDFERLTSSRPQITRIFRSLLLSFLLLIALGYALKITQVYSRGWMATWFVLTMTALSVERWAIVRILRSAAYRGYFNKKVAVLGAGILGRRLLEHLSKKGHGAAVAGIYDDRQGADTRDMLSGENTKYAVTGSIADLVIHGQENRFDQIIIALPGNDAGRINEAMNRLSILPAEILICPDDIAFSLRRPSITYSGNLGLLNIYGKPITGWGSLLKFTFDFFLSTVLLVILALPMLLIAIIIKLSDLRKPVLFKQERHGFNHKVFKVWKFRTMNVLENGPDIRQAQAGDIRITKIGRFLRSTSLDELPQLFNVLMGTMSLVGPRPHALAHNNQYSSMLELYANRHRVKPGITGWAQVNGFRGETKDTELMKKRVEYDLEYIDNWSIWFDLKVLATTPITLLFHKAH